MLPVLLWLCIGWILTEHCSLSSNQKKTEHIPPIQVINKVLNKLNKYNWNINLVGIYEKIWSFKFHFLLHEPELQIAPQTVFQPFAGHTLKRTTPLSHIHTITEGEQRCHPAGTQVKQVYHNTNSLIAVCQTKCYMFRGLWGAQ